MLARMLALSLLLLEIRPAAAEFPEEFEATFIVSGSEKAELEWHREDMVPILNVIPGAIFGRPRADIVLPISKGENSALTAPLSDWTELVNVIAIPLTEEYAQLGLQVEPDSTKIARLGTFVYDGKHGVRIGGYLNELGEKSSLILIYVDAACTIKGDIEVEGTTYHHEIDIPAAGFHYLEADNANHIRRATPIEQVLFVTVH
ncbi:MAG: hypothetical protein R3358_03510 [Woeseiaceae bacterium]|nr:hypothetical protein [Woeseiaceae bacterium]